MEYKPHLELISQIDGKTVKTEIPQYSLKYPNYNRVSLAAVKNGIYHPDLSTIQKNVNETLLSKFSIENSKTSTALDNEKFAYSQEDKLKVSYPVKLAGNIEESSKRFYSQHNAELIYEPVASDFKIKSSVISGRENLRVGTDQKVKEQFRFNRIRAVPSEHPEHGHRPCYFNTNPGLDKFGLKVEATTASKYRKNDGYKYSNLAIADSFKPYGCSL